jgi:hypothetical protein
MRNSAMTFGFGLFVYKLLNWLSTEPGEVRNCPSDLCSVPGDCPLCPIIEVYTRGIGDLNTSVDALKIAPVASGSFARRATGFTAALSDKRAIFLGGKIEKTASVPGRARSPSHESDT